MKKEKKKKKEKGGVQVRNTRGKTHQTNNLVNKPHQQKKDKKKTPPKHGPTHYSQQKQPPQTRGSDNGDETNK